jgi:hypothetical protein
MVTRPPTSTRRRRRRRRREGHCYRIVEVSYWEWRDKAMRVPVRGGRLSLARSKHRRGGPHVEWQADLQWLLLRCHADDLLHQALEQCLLSSCID